MVSRILACKKGFRLVLSIAFFLFIHQPAVLANPAEIKNCILSGKITDAKTGLPIAGAVLYLHEAKLGLITNEQGLFKTAPIPAGHYLVEISFLGYSSILETISLQGDLIRNFQLKERYVENEEVTVTGVAYASKVKQSAQPISVVKKAKLIQATASNIMDALTKLVPGFSTITTGPAIAKPVIRGLGYNRVVTVHDGVRQEGQQWGDEHGIEIDEYSIQKVEILKGPASLFYGSDAMAGVIHLISNAPIERGMIKGSVMSTLHSNNGMWGGNANLAGHLKNGLNWNLYGSSKSAGDYQNKWDGFVLNSRFKEANFGGYIGLNKSWGYSHLLISKFNQQLGMVEGDRDPSTGKFLLYPNTLYERIASQEDLSSRGMVVPYQQVSHFKLATDNSILLGKGRLAFHVGYQENKRKELADPDAPKLPELYFDLKTINYGIQYNFLEKKGWKSTLGLTGMRQQNTNLASESIIPNYLQHDMGLFFFSKKSLTNLLVMSGGFRFDHRQIKGEELYEGADLKFPALQNSYRNLSGSIGLGYAISDAVNLKINIARGFRAPNLSELASNGAHEGTYRYEYGDPNLQSETSLQLDAGLEINSEHINLGFTGFYNSIQHYIYYSKLASKIAGDSLVNVNGEQLTAFKYRQASANLLGFEVNFDFHPHPFDWLHIENSFSMVVGKFNQAVEGAQYLPFIPAPRLETEIRAQFKNEQQQWYVKFEMSNTARQKNIFTAYQTETETPAYTLMHVGIGTDYLRKGKTALSLHLSLNNLFDVAYQPHTSRLKYTAENLVTGRQGVFSMGRNLVVKCIIPFQWVP